MQRIQKLLVGLPLAIGCAFLAGCNKDSGAKSVADYIHDIDSANARLHLAKSQDPIKAMQDPDVMNASQAVAQSMDPKYLACWNKKAVITANADHACLDSHGFIRK